MAAIATAQSMAVISRQDHYQFIIVFLLASAAVQIRAERVDTQRDGGSRRLANRTAHANQCGRAWSDAVSSRSSTKDMCVCVCV